MNNIVERAKLCSDVLSQVQNISGDVIELGVGYGSTTFVLAEFIKKNNINKKIYACDCFKGLPYTDKEFGVDSDLLKGECRGYSKEQFQKKVTELGFENIIVIIDGLFEDTLYSQLSDKQFCFAWVDPDLYKATSYAYKFLESRINLKGVVGFHDYKFFRCPGVTLVVDKEINYNMYEKYLLEYSCIFIRRIK